MEYNHEKAVADGVNVDKRDRQTRKKRWEQLDDDFQYDANQLDRDVVAEDQIRTVLQTFRDKLFTEIFPGRDQVPKTLIFAKDDSHADDSHPFPKALTGPACWPKTATSWKFIIVTC